jgi:hypothetical protein
MSKPDSDILQEFHLAARSVQLDYLLIGGLAVSYWSKPRFTADVDYVVSRTSFDKARQAASLLGYREAFVHPKLSFAHFENEANEVFRIDFMLVNDDTWEKLLADSSLASLGGIDPYPIVSPLHLIAMKLHAAKQSDRRDSYKDLNDVAEILLAQQITLGDLEQTDILSKHGAEETITKLRDILKSKA